MKKIIPCAGFLITFIINADVFAQIMQQPIPSSQQTIGGPSQDELEEATYSCGGNQYTFVCNAGDNGYLQILGSSNDDVIYVVNSGFGEYGCVSGDLSVVVGRACAGADVVVVYGYRGNDMISAETLSVPVVIYGGAGNDKIKGTNQDDEINGEVGRLSKISF